MKKRNLGLLLLTNVLLLTACNQHTTENGSSNPLVSDSTSVSESLSSQVSSMISTIPLTYDAEYIYKSFSEMGKSKNYEIVYSVNDVEYHDVFNPSYVYYDLNKNGGVLLDSYDTQNYPNKILYQFEINNQNVDVLSVLTDTNYEPLTSIDEFDFMTLINEPRYKIDEDSIETDRDGTLYSENKNLILVLATVLGYYEYAIEDLFDRVVFKIGRNGEIEFILQMYSTDGNMNYESVVSAQFANIGNAHNETMDAFLKNFKISDEQLSVNAISSIKNNQVSTNSTITLYYGSDEPLVIGEQNIDINNQYLQVSTYDSETKKSSSQLYKNINGTANICGVNAYNQPAVEDSNISWNELAWPKDVFDCNAFRKLSNNTYHYYGAYADMVFYSLTYLMLDTVKSIDIKVENNQIVEMNTVFSNSYDSSTNTIYHYSVKTTFVDAREIVEPKSWPVNQEENAKIAASFENFKANHKYRVTAYDFDYKNTQKVVMTVVDNVVLYEISSSEGSMTYGFVEKNGKVIPFEVNLDKSLSVAGTPDVGGKIEDYITFDMSSEIFTINEAGRYVVKDNLVGLEDHMFIGPNTTGMIADSLSMIVDNNGYISKIVYNYSVDLENGQTITGTDHMDIDQYGTAKLTNKMKSEIEKLN